MVKRLYKIIVNEGITPDQFYILYWLKEGILPAHIEIDNNINTLIEKGFLTVEKKITNKTKELLKKIPSSTTVNNSKIDENKIKEYNELFPKMRLPSGKLARNSLNNLKPAFEWFFKNYNYSWDTIFKATKVYLSEREVDNWNYTKTSRYFIRKYFHGASWISELANYCEMVEQGLDEKKADFEDNVF